MALTSSTADLSETWPTCNVLRKVKRTILSVMRLRAFPKVLASLAFIGCSGLYWALEIASRPCKMFGDISRSCNFVLRIGSTNLRHSDKGYSSNIFLCCRPKCTTRLACSWWQNLQVAPFSHPPRL